MTAIHWAQNRDADDSAWVTAPIISTEEFREQHRATLREYASTEPPSVNQSKTT
jgi:hypothetical protein